MCKINKTKKHNIKKHNIKKRLPLVVIVLYVTLSLVGCGFFIFLGKKCISWMSMEPNFEMTVECGDKTQRVADTIWNRSDHSEQKYIEEVYLYVSSIPYDMSKSDRLLMPGSVSEQSLDFKTEWDDLCDLFQAESAMEAVYIRSKKATEVETPDETIVSRDAICWEKADLFAALMRCKQIPCEVIIGSSKNNPDLWHAWNRVTVDGQDWYFDTTNQLQDIEIINELFKGVYTYRLR